MAIDSSNVLESFLVALGFEVDTDGLDQFQGKVAELAKIGSIVTGALYGAGLAVGGFVALIADEVDTLGDFAEREKVAVDAISELGHAAQLSGSSMEAVQSSIEGLNKTTGEAVLGLGRGGMAFKKLGLSAKDETGKVKTFDVLLEDIAEKMKGLSNQEQIAMAEKLGIDRSLIPLLLKGREGIRQLREEARAFGAVTEKDAEVAGKFSDSLDRTRFMLQGLARSVGIALMPAINDVLDGFQEWLLVNKDIVRSNITHFVELLSKAIGVTWRLTTLLVDSLIDLYEWLTKTKIGLAVLAGGLALLTKFAVYQTIMMIAQGFRILAGALTLTNIAAFATSLIIGGLILAVGLLIDDFLNWRAGNESLIGDLLAKYPELKTGIESIGEAYNAVKIIVLDVLDSMYTGWSGLLILIFDFIDRVVLWFSNLKAKGGALFNDLEIIVFDFIDKAVNLFNGFQRVVEGVLQFIVNGFRNAANKVGAFFDGIAGGVRSFAGFLGFTLPPLTQNIERRIKPAEEGEAIESPVEAGDTKGTSPFISHREPPAEFKEEKAPLLKYLTLGRENPPVEIEASGTPSRRQGKSLTAKGQASINPQVGLSILPIPSTAPPLLGTEKRGMAPPSVIQPTNNTTSNTYETRIEGVEINIESTDPKRAGAEVKTQLKELGERHTIRNAQSAVKL